MKIILAFKTHFDIGFTDLSEKVIGQYAGEMLSQVVETCDATAGMGALKYVWTMPAWPLQVMQQAKPAARAALDRLVKSGQLTWHALPFTSHFDFGSVAEAVEGLRCARELSEDYGLPLPISAKMTDVPGHGQLLPTILAGAGVRFLHLGCNEYATPPAVPPLFFWEGPDGSRTLTMYGKGGYGSSPTPPAGWPYPVWMSLMHTHDNCGPQTADMLLGIVEQVQRDCPGAQIVCGTMDDFYKELAKCDLSALPVVRRDLADSWIHGAGSYPREVGLVRETRRTLAAAEAAAALTGTDLSALRRAAMDDLILFDEHTWGLDVKTWLPADRVYEKKAFLQAKETSAYRRMERSWNEQRARAEGAAAHVREAAELLPGGSAVVNPNGAPFTGWARAEDGLTLGGTPRVYVENVPALGAASAPAQPQAAPLALAADGTLENHRYRLTVDRARGRITELFDKRLGRALLREREDAGVFAYRYDVYGMDDMTEYLRAYAYRFSDWGVRDNGRDNYPECEHQLLQPVFESLSIEGCTVSLHYRGAGFAAYGDGERVTVSVSLPPVGDELFVHVSMENKAETPFVESGSLLLPLAADAPRYRFNKNGNLIDPATDIEDGANHAFYSLEAFACAEDEAGGLCAVTHDAPLCAIGEPGVYAFRKRYEAHEPVLYFNLFNNMWGTNFPQWMGGDLSWSFTLFGYEGACGGAVYARALALENGARVLPVQPGESPLRLPSGVQPVSVVPCENGGLTLCLRDTALAAGKRTLEAPGRTITPVDLRGTPLGKPVRDALAFELPAFGLRSFEIR